MKDVDLQEIIDVSGMYPLKIRNVYVFGSRVYGTATEHSDYDIQIVGMSMLPKDEIKSSKYNIHIHAHDVFKEDLFNYTPKNVECLLAPKDCILQEKMNFGFELNKLKMVQEFMQSSYQSWRHAKYKTNQGDFYRGRKGIFHALRILAFGIQLKESGKIEDWSIVNFMKLK